MPVLTNRTQTSEVFELVPRFQFFFNTDEARLSCVFLLQTSPLSPSSPSSSCDYHLVTFPRILAAFARLYLSGPWPLLPLHSLLQYFWLLSFLTHWPLFYSCAAKLPSQRACVCFLCLKYCAWLIFSWLAPSINVCSNITSSEKPSLIDLFRHHTATVSLS